MEQKEVSGIVFMVAVHLHKGAPRCIVEMKGGNCDDPFSYFTFTGGMIEQARALNPGDTVTISGTSGDEGRLHYIGRSIIGNQSII